MRTSRWASFAAVALSAAMLLTQCSADDPDPDSRKATSFGEARATRDLDLQFDALEAIASAAAADVGRADATSADTVTWSTIVHHYTGDSKTPAVLNAPKPFALEPDSRAVLPPELLANTSSLPFGMLRDDKGRVKVANGISITGAESDKGFTFRLSSTWKAENGSLQRSTRELVVTDPRVPDAAPSTVALDTDGALLHVTFDTNDQKWYSASQARMEWNNRNGSVTGFASNPEGSLTRQTEDGNTFLEKVYPKGRYNSKDPSVDDRLLIQWKLDQPLDEAYFAYRIQVGAEFDPALGGKLPGLCGGTCPTGGQAVTTAPQGTHSENNPIGLAVGWNGRAMWRADGHLVQYLYFPDQTTNYAPDFPYARTGGALYLNDGGWHTIENHVRMNTPGKHDGLFETYYDGQLVLRLTSMRFRDDDSYGIDSLKLTGYFGGHDPDWAPATDSIVRYDDIVVSEQPITH